ncbi:tail sheath protein [Alphaproteobacteria bacterium]|nr:tail sheath protein [Alphaproteobacteria bacterium]
MLDMPNSAFNQIPADLRVSGTFIEIDGSAAANPSLTTQALIIGQRLASGSAEVGEAILVEGQGATAGALFGRGSMLAAMVRAFRANNQTIPLYAIPLNDGTGARAEAAITVTGTATAAGVITLWIGGASIRSIGDSRVQVGVASGDAAATIRAAIVAAVNASLDQPVTATIADDTVTLTAKHAGLIFNELRVQVNLAGKIGGEEMPPGIQIVTPGYFSGGSGAPDISGAIAAMGDVAYDTIIMPYTDAASLSAIEAEMADRWGPGRQLYGLVYSARNGTLSELTAFGKSRNSQYVSVLAGYDRPGPGYLAAARVGAVVGAALFNHPARALVGLELIGEQAEPKTSELTLSDKNQLLWSGLSILDRQQGNIVAANRIITTYQLNSAGDNDEAYLDVTTLATLARLARELKFILNSRYVLRRSVLVEDGDSVAPGIPLCSPRLAKGTLIEHYKTLALQAFVENVEGFAERLKVSKVGTRLNVLYAPDLGNPLYTVAAQIQFYLDFTTY